MLCTYGTLCYIQVRQSTPHDYLDMVRMSQPGYVPLQADVPADDTGPAAAGADDIQLNKDSVRYTREPGAGHDDHDSYLQPYSTSNGAAAAGRDTEQQVKDDGEGYTGIRKPSYVTTMENDAYEPGVCDVPVQQAPDKPTSQHYLSPTAMSDDGENDASRNDGYLPPALVGGPAHGSIDIDDATANYTNL